jgi:hypothetical protein
MRRLWIVSLGLVFLVGCVTPQRYVVDVAKTEGCDDFDWNGRVTVTMTWKGIFGGGTTVDLIKLESRDGRSLLLDTTRGSVEAYTEVKVKKLRHDGTETTRSPNAGEQ